MFFYEVVVVSLHIFEQHYEVPLGVILLELPKEETFLFVVAWDMLDLSLIQISDPRSRNVTLHAVSTWTKTNSNILQTVPSPRCAANKLILIHIS